MNIATYIKKNRLSQSEFGKLIGVTQGMVWQWLHGKQVSAESAVKIDQITEGAIARHELRPDIFGKKVA